MEGNTLEDTLYILPCLQERRQNFMNTTKSNLSILSKIEKEQEGSIIDNNGNIKPIDPDRNTSDVFNDVWIGKKDQSTGQNMSIDNVLKNKGDNRKGLIAPNLPTFETNCKDIDTSRKWEMFGNFAKDNLQDGGTLMLITHHNRMRGFTNNDPQALIPLNASSKCKSYANNVCFRIVIDNDQPLPDDKIKITIPYAGFPDKGGFDTNCKIDSCDKNGCNKTTGGGNNYCCDDSITIGDINFKVVIDGLNKCNITKKTIIYIIRHGNSLHNKPLDIKDGTQTDSSLTYLGMYQAKILGEYLKNSEYNNDFNNNNKIILGASFLSRTQLTGLSILKNILGRLPPNMEFNYDLLMKMAVNRLSNFSADNFFINGKVFAPLNNNNKNDFRAFIDEIKGKSNRPLESLQYVETTREKLGPVGSLGGKTKKKNKRSKTRRKSTSKPRRNKRVKTRSKKR